MKRITGIGLMFLLATLSVDARTWTSVSGAKVEAEFVSLDGDYVVLETPQGKKLKIRISLDHSYP